ncbi:MAG: DUF58 domain-containing protein, partial [Pseudomonadota bacterium]
GTAAGPLPRSLKNKSTYIMPNAFGLMFTVLLSALLAGSANYNNNLGFLMAFFLGGMAFVSILHTHRNLIGITLSGVQCEPVFAGEEAVFEFLMDSGGRERRALAFKLAGADAVVEDLPAKGIVRVRTRVPTNQRGLFSPGRLTVFTRFPFGIFRAWSQVETGAECVVYPRPLDSRMAWAALSRGEENGAGKKARQAVDDFSGLRAYVPGDPPRHLWWKAYSRGLGLQTKTFSGSQGEPVYLDFSALADPDPEKRLSRLCAMVLAAERGTRPYGLSLPGRVILPSRGEAHRRTCLTALALFGSPGKNA